MNTLPLELLTHILTHLPPSSLRTTRLVSHTFESLSFTLLFTPLLNWLSYENSHAAIMALAHDVWNRPAVMWSPWASCPDGPVREEWLGVVWRLQMRSGLVNFGDREKQGGLVEREGGEEGEVVRLTAENYAKSSGKEEMTENRLRTAQNRYLMHRSYSDGKGDGMLVEDVGVVESVVEGRFESKI